jgi:alkylhydroperoxidase family enzyme
MARIRPASPERSTPLFGPEASLVERIYANQGALAPTVLGAVRATTRGDQRLSPRLVELLRLRIAFHNQCRSCMASRYAPGAVDEGLVCSLERPPEAEDLTAAEKVALDYADRLATDHLSIDDATFERLRGHFDEGEIVELGMVCGMCVGMGRVMATWDMVDELPERFRARGTVITPWEPEALSRRS